MNKTFKYIVLLALACFVGKANAQELKTEVFSLLNLDYPGLEKVKALHQEGKDADAAKALLDYYRARTNVKTPDINLKKVTIGKDEQKMADETGRRYRPLQSKSGFRLEPRRALCTLARQAVCQQGPYRKRYPLLPRRCLHLSSGGRNRIQDTCQPHPLRRREGNGTGLVQQQEPEYHHRSHAGGNPRPGDAERRRAHRRLQRQEVRTHTGRTARRFTFALHDRLVERSHSL